MKFRLETNDEDPFLRCGECHDDMKLRCIAVRLGAACAYAEVQSGEGDQRATIAKEHGIATDAARELRGEGCTLGYPSLFYQIRDAGWLYGEGLGFGGDLS